LAETERFELPAVSSLVDSTTSKSLENRHFLKISLETVHHENTKVKYKVKYKTGQKKNPEGKSCEALGVNLHTGYLMRC